MKLAIGLFGISYKENYEHWRLGRVTIDYRKSLENYRKYLFEYFESLGYQIDVYLATYDSKMINQLKHDYQPKEVRLIEHLYATGDLWYNLLVGRQSRHNCIKACLEMIINSQQAYDHILLTRFDLIFCKPLSSVSIDCNALNIVSILESREVICDNFYLFPGKYSQKLLTKLKERDGGSYEDNNYDYHAFEPLFLEVFPKINFMTNECRKAEYLSFYKIACY